jgi:sodium/myo-inositol cotransporter 3
MYLVVVKDTHAQGATLMAGFIKILPLFMMVMPGMISRILYTGKNSI